MSGKYYPNNFDAIAKAPEEFFEDCSWEEFYDWRMCQWDLPASVYCIIRAAHKDTGKVTEHVYQQPRSAQRRLHKYLNAGTHEITIANHETIHVIRLKKDTVQD